MVDMAPQPVREAFGLNILPVRSRLPASAKAAQICECIEALLAEADRLFSEAGA